MPGLALPAYFLYIYILFPAILRSLTTLYSKRYVIGPLVKCIVPLVACIGEPACRSWLEEIAECSDPNSMVRRLSAQTYAHVQHPEDPAFCQYHFFDRVQTNTTLAYLECVGQSGCLPPATNSDTCANLSNTTDTVLHFSTIPPYSLQGTWKKLYTTGWDLWPCQWTEFWPPSHLATTISKRDLLPPDSWMTQWPHATNVWRMNLFWKSPETSNITFYMSNEMYPFETWESLVMASTTPATLRTRAVMWGIEARENWYLLHYDADWQTMLIYSCAYTQAVDRFDSSAFVLQKEGLPTITDEHAEFYKALATQVLGDLNGKLQQVASCQAEQ